LETLAHVSAAVREIERELAEAGRVLVRYSGTEAKLRLLVEGPTEVRVAAAMARLKEAVARDGL
jgi:phosphoglucosamine mutase